MHIVDASLLAKRLAPCTSASKLGASRAHNPHEADASCAGKKRAGLTSGVLGLGLVVACVRGGGFRVSQRWSLGLGVLELAKDVGLLWLYLSYKVRAQLISQAASRVKLEQSIS